MHQQNKLERFHSTPDAGTYCLSKFELFLRLKVVENIVINSIIGQFFKFYIRKLFQGKKHIIID
jgi:hypothetical protein